MGFRLVILLVLGWGSMSGGRAAGSRAPQPTGQIRQPPKRHLPFPSTRPPFLAPDEYHRFPGPDGRGIAGDETADALVIKTPVSFLVSFPYFVSPFCVFSDGIDCFPLFFGFLILERNRDDDLCSYDVLAPKHG